MKLSCRIIATILVLTLLGATMPWTVLAEELPAATQTAEPGTTVPEETVPEATAPEVSALVAETEGLQELELFTEEVKSSAAVAVATSGTCGENLIWYVEEDTLYISGTGPMYDYECEGAEYVGDAPEGSSSPLPGCKKIVIQEGVTTIGSHAIDGCIHPSTEEGPESVVIPSTVVSIADGAFAGCGRLKDITMGSGVTTIGHGAFMHCYSLESIYISENVTTIGDRAFMDCYSLESIYISENVTRIGDYAFSECKKLTDVYYAGTTDQLSQITIDVGNIQLTNAAWHTGGDITEISLNVDSVKTTYRLGEALDLTGLKVNAIYSNGSVQEITDGLTVTGFSSAEVGEKVLTVSYQGFTDTFTITVTNQTAVATVNGKEYYELNLAIAASSAKYPVVLMKNVDTLVLTKSLYLDLNGCDVSAVTTGSYKLYVMDTATADFDVSDGVYGKILAADKATNVKAMTGYLKAADELSFHRYEMELTDLVVNTEERGITYKSSFKVDQYVQAQIKEFGIAMRAYNAPNETSIWADPDCKTHVALTKEQWTNNAVKSVYVSNIIDPTLDVATNRARAWVGIFGRAYILLEDGTMIFGGAQSFSMQSAMEHVDYYFDSEYLEDEDRQNLVNFYNNPAYKSFMETWNIPNIKAKAAAGEEN